MGIQVVSNTDSKEHVDQLNGIKSEESKKETNSVSTEEVDENIDDSDSSEDLSDGTDKENVTEDKNEQKKPGNGFKKRIDRFKKQLTEKDKEVNFWKEQALKGGKAETDKPESQPKVENKSELVKPKLTDFETQEEYLDAITDYKIALKEEEKANESKKNTAKTEFTTQLSTFQSKAAEFAKTQKDFGQVLDDVDDIVMTPGLQEAFMSSENGPQLMYELAKNREEYERINDLSPLQQAREIGRLEASLSKPEAQPTKPTTKAPAPITPVGNNSSGSLKKTIYDEDIDQAEFERLVKKEQKK